jgi:medium-chain acyl-[acyl-carrier-protein] hydrolase
MHDLPGSEFVSALKSFGGMPDAILADAELMRAVEPVLRADFELIETWQESVDAVLEVPFLCWAGSADAAASVPAVGQWRRNAGGRFRLRVFDGDHFFIHRSEPTVLRSLDEELTALGL